MSALPKRLIEVDLPIATISAHARREKAIRQGHISTMHIWWARRPLAACRAVVLAAALPDPLDPQCPPAFTDAAALAMRRFRDRRGGRPRDWGSATALRAALLEFIGDFASWEHGRDEAFLETARSLVRAAGRSLGAVHGDAPLAFDPFAGGGSIPLEALRLGLSAFATDLNPIPVLLNKVQLEFAPRLGQDLVDAVAEWGERVRERAATRLAGAYPCPADGTRVSSYHWARTIVSEAPGESEPPVEVPLLRSLWLSKKAGRKWALRWQTDTSGRVLTETVAVTFSDGQTRTVRRPLLEPFQPRVESEVLPGTVRRGSATCPVTGFTTPLVSVKKQLKTRRGGSHDARLLVAVVTRKSQAGKTYRAPNSGDVEALAIARDMLAEQMQIHTDGLSFVPTESTAHYHSFVNRGPIYGMNRWLDYYLPRQALALGVFSQEVKRLGTNLGNELSADLALAVRTCLAFAVDRMANQYCALAKWHNGRELVDGVFSRQAIAMLWDFGELGDPSTPDGYWDGALKWISDVLRTLPAAGSGESQQASATSLPLPDDSADLFVTDPPYYYSVQYADLSDFFYVWLRRSLGDAYPRLFEHDETNKDREIIVQSPSHELAATGKNKAFYERHMQLAMAEARRVLAPNGIGIVVFAHTSTAGWEAQLQAMVHAGWIITGAWPIDTELASRVISQGRAVLASSIHLICRPRETEAGELAQTIGDWRDVLSELPGRVHEWMPRLAAEGVVGADAIFACLGPALEIFTRYSKVEKSNGEAVTLGEYLEHVWAAVAGEALSTIFQGVDASGLEPDARLTAMWLWTLSTGGPPAAAADDEPEDDASDDEEQETSAKGSGAYVLEYDAARKIAQGLGAHLDRLPEVVRVEADVARLLTPTERMRSLLSLPTNETPGRSKRRVGRVSQVSLFEALGEGDPASALPAGQVQPGPTTLDRVHQAMLLFGAGRGDALRRFLVDEVVGADAKVWTLAQALSALYPAGSDEKRWVDGVLSRKKAFGF